MHISSLGASTSKDVFFKEQAQEHRQGETLYTIVAYLDIYERHF